MECLVLISSRIISTVGAESLLNPLPSQLLSFNQHVHRYRWLLYASSLVFSRTDGRIFFKPSLFDLQWYNRQDVLGDTLHYLITIMFFLLVCNHGFNISDF